MLPRLVFSCRRLGMYAALASFALGEALTGLHPQGIVLLLPRSLCGPPPPYIFLCFFLDLYCLFHCVVNFFKVFLDCVVPGEFLGTFDPFCWLFCYFFVSYSNWSGPGYLCSNVPCGIISYFEILVFSGTQNKMLSPRTWAKNLC